MPQWLLAHAGGWVSAEPRRNLGTGAALATVAQIANALTGGVTGIVVARLLGPEGTGPFTVLLSLVLLLTAASTLGIETGASYHVSGRRWRASDALRQCQLAALALGLVGGLVGGGVALATSGSAFRGISALDITLALCALPAALSWTYVAAIVLALERYASYAVAISSQGLTLMLFVAVLTPLFGLTGALVAVLASNVIPAVGLLLWARARLPRAEPGWIARSRRDLGAASSFGVRAYLTNLLSYLNQRADLFILNASAAGAAVGYYSIALSVTALGLLLPRALSAVSMPRIAALDAEAADGETVDRSTRHAVLLALLSTALLAAVLPLVPLIYGPDFDESIALGYILLPGIGLLGVGNVLAATIVGKGRPEYSLYTVLVVTPPTLFLYFVLVPALGADGAALASTLSYSAIFALLLMYYRRVAPGPLRQLAPGREELADYAALASRGLAALRHRRQ